MTEDVKILLVTAEQEQLIKQACRSLGLMSTLLNEEKFEEQGRALGNLIWNLESGEHRKYRLMREVPEEAKYPA